VALDLVDGTVNGAHIALGGVATKPWRSREAEAVLNGNKLDEDGNKLDEDAARRAADAAFGGARPRDGNQYKAELGKRALVRALLQAQQMNV
jgi:xanthine dehydrogenase YagS FAD-binding subunit